MLNIRIYSEKIENPIIQASTCIVLHYPSLFVYLFLLMLLFLFYFVFGGRLCID